MQIKQDRIVYALRELLTDAARYFHRTQFAQSQVELGEGPAGATFGDLHHDQDLPADKAMGEWFADEVYIRQGGLRIRRVVIEGREAAVEVTPEGVATLYVDPLDNSQGFHAYMNMRPEDRLLSPHTFATVITLVQEWTDDGTPISPKFKDIIAAGMIALSPSANEARPLLPLPRECVDRPNERTWTNPSPFTRKSDEMFGLNATVIFEAYYPETRAVVEAGYRDVSGALRSMGCAALEMVYPSIDAAAGYICTSQKLHELGAAWQIARSREAIAFTWSVEDGLAVRRRPLDDEPYIFNSKMPVCIARDMATADELWRRIQRGYAIVRQQSGSEDGCE